MSSNNDSTILEIIDLYPQEMELLKAIRNNWRYGEVTILVRDGLPYRLRRVTDFVELNPNAEFNTKPIDKKVDK